MSRSGRIVAATSRGSECAFNRSFIDIFRHYLITRCVAVTSDSYVIDQECSERGATGVETDRAGAG